MGDTEGTTSLSAYYGKEVGLICTLCTVIKCKKIVPMSEGEVAKVNTHVVSV